MADKVLIDLATGMEEGERVMIAFLVAGAALERGRDVAESLTKDAVHLALPDHAEGGVCDGCPTPGATVRAVHGRGRRCGNGSATSRERS